MLLLRTSWLALAMILIAAVSALQPPSSALQPPNNVRLVSSEDSIEQSAKGTTIGDEEAKSKFDGLLKEDTIKKHSMISNIFRLRFITTLIKKCLRLLGFTDPDVISIVSRFISWVTAYHHFLISLILVHYFSSSHV